jgi:DNA polymerase-3 subunit delta
VAFVPAGVRDFNLNVFHGFEADLAEVLGAARTVPFMAPRRVVILRDIDKMRLTEGRGEQLEEYLRSPSPQAVLVVTTDLEERSRDLRKRYGALWADVVFAPPQGRDLETRVRQEAERLGCAIDPGAVGALLEATGSDLGRALGELEKLRTALGAGGRIGPAEVALHVAGYAHRSVFELLEAVSARDLAASLRIVGGLALKPEDALAFMGLLGKRLRALWFFARPERPLPPVFKTWPARPEELRAHAARFSREELEQALAALLEVDTAIKSTGLPPRLLLESYFIRVLGAPRLPARPLAAARPQKSSRKS